MSKKCCSQSVNVFIPTSLRLNTLFEIYCSFITSHIKKAKQSELINLSAATYAVFTVLKKKGNNYVRKITTVTMENGKYAIGTELDKNSKAYISLQAGNSFTGPGILFGKTYYNWYWIIDDEYVGYLGTLN